MQAVKSTRDNNKLPKIPDVKVPEKKYTQDPEVADRFNRVLGDTVEAMENAGLRYVFIGGIASGGLGRPRSTHDVDLFVQPEDAELVLHALAKHGFTIEKTDPSWLYKGWKENILVDVIFKSKGEIYLDNEMYQRAMTAPFHGRSLKLVAPEDLLIIKAAAHSELTPGHWHDAIALLTHATMDWEYLLKRARRAPRRILSLLLYAQSNDVWVPNSVIYQLYDNVFGENSHASPRAVAAPAPKAAAPAQTPRPTAVPTHSPNSPNISAGNSGSVDCYGLGHLRTHLAEDPRTNELDIHAEYHSGKLLLRGEVSLAERRQAVEEVARECFPDATVDNQIRLLEVHGPLEHEEMK